MDLRKRIGKRIQELRNNKNLKQSELAEMVNIATKTQSCIETGRNLPSAELFTKYAQALNIDEAELLDIKHIKTKDELLIEINSMLQSATEEEIITSHRILRCIIKAY